MVTNEVVRHLLWIEKNCNVETSLRALRRNAFLILAPFTLALIVSLFWYFIIWRFDLYCSPDAAQQHGTIIAVIFVIYAIPAGLVFVKSWERYSEISNAVWMKDKTAFMLIRDRVMPFKLHILFSTMGLTGLVVVMIAGHPSWGSGFASVFASWFIMTMYFIVTLQLQDPSTSAWFSVDVPEDWINDDPREHLIKVGIIKP